MNKKIIGIAGAMALASSNAALAALPVAPFISPAQVTIPSGSAASPGTYARAPWLGTGGSTSTFKRDFYISDVRRRGNIVSLVVLKRTQRKETAKMNRNTPGYGNGLFLPSYIHWVMRFDCTNDTSSTQTVAFSTDAYGGSDGFMYPINRQETEWKPTPGQVKVVIEGRPYWVMRPSADPRHEKKPLVWNQTVPGSYGATHLDRACSLSSGPYRGQ